MQRQAFSRIKVAVEHIVWNRNVVEAKLLERNRKTKQACLKAFETHKDSSIRLRTLYLTQFEAITSRMKNLVFSELKHYS